MTHTFSSRRVSRLRRGISIACALSVVAFAATIAVKKIAAPTAPIAAKSATPETPTNPVAPSAANPPEPDSTLAAQTMAEPTPAIDAAPTVASITPGTTWDWILSAKPTTVHLDASRNPKKLIDLDLEDTPTATIADLQKKGITVICYFSAGSYENWRSDAAAFSTDVIGKNNGWEGERWVDIRASAVRAIMAARMDVAARKGCDGVEPDNVDGYTNDTGFPLTAADQLAFNIALAQMAHDRHLAIALKNDVEQVAALAPYFDFAINEQCNRYNECDAYRAFTDANKAVLNAEYDASSLRCARTNAANIDSVLFAEDLDGSIYTACR